ncbi:MAG: hypothetical protein BM564_00795 [Bacteroidetes bacterium MedPE-SWsnd-G2]|nr:MAG: hypothetical protein BM564_00795 [Bacteroidetes bacterium MedPE-SWsnd-G2]
MAQECVKVNYKLRGYFYAGSSQIDSLSLGGFYAAKNTPQPCSDNILNLISQNEIQVVVATDSLASFSEKYAAFKVYIINGSDKTQTLEAQDSRLYMKRQVFYKDKWHDVEYIPSSWCGNSYHNVFIKSKEYWEFSAPCFKGKIDAKFRFALTLSNSETIYSNSFNGSFNKAQLKKEQGHKTQGIMDPYNN